jgi:hypothetical protein
VIRVIAVCVVLLFGVALANGNAAARWDSTDGWTVFVEQTVWSVDAWSVALGGSASTSSVAGTAVACREAIVLTCSEIRVSTSDGLTVAFFVLFGW